MADDNGNSQQGNQNGEPQNAQQNQNQNPPPQQNSAPQPTQNNSQSNANTSDLANLTTLVAGLPERMAEIVREAMPKNNPPADPPKRTQAQNQNNDSGDNGNGTSSTRQQAKDEPPGTKKHAFTLFGVPWL